MLTVSLQRMAKTIKGHYLSTEKSRLERRVEKIEREVRSKERADLLAVSQGMAELRFPAPALLQLLGGRDPMIESPLLQKMIAEAIHQDILALLKACWHLNVPNWRHFAKRC